MDHSERTMALLGEIVDELGALVESLDKLNKERRPWSGSVASAHGRRAARLVDRSLHLVKDAGERSDRHLAVVPHTA